MGIIDFPSQGTIGANLQPKRYDIVIYQGDTFSFDLILKDDLDAAVDVTGWTAIAQIRKVADSLPGETPTMATTVGGVDGKISITLSDTDTAALIGNTEYKYDVQLSDGSNTRTYIGGRITVTEDVTE